MRNSEQRWSENSKKGFGQIFGWIMLVCGLLTLLFYGISFFINKPTVETITTHAPASGNTQNVKFESSRKP